MVKILERRRYPRVSRALAINHRLYKRKGVFVDGSWQISTTKDMSITGILFSSDIRYLTGDTIQLRVVMSGILDVFRGFGRIVRVEPSKKKGCQSVAVAFIEEDSEYAKKHGLKSA